MTVTIGRRELLAALGSAAAAWPLAARAQQAGEHMRRVGVLMSVAADGPEGQARLAAFLNGLRQAGWIEGRNVRIDQRWGAGDAERARKYAAELVALGPDVILASGDHSVVASQQATRTVPIVFTLVSDPVGTGYVGSLARPGGNMTGFTLFEYSTSAKYLEVLKEIAPGVKRAAVVREAGTATGTGQFAAIQAAAPALGVELSAIGVRDAGEIEGGIAAFARSPNSGLIVTGSAPAAVHSHLIVALAHHKLPAAYFARFVVAAGGLISYGPDFLDVHRRPAAYVDRILKGEKPADLPVQAPTKYELVINLKTAKTLGLEVPSLLLARADEVIE
jgi:putative tryptophan/tyrosine transport system substrate-binding protein